MRGLWGRRRPTVELLALVDGDPPLGRRHVMLLAHIGTEGEQTVSELAAAIGLSLPAVSKLTRELEEHRLIERREDPADRRRTVVRLNAATAHGGARLARAAQQAARAGARGARRRRARGVPEGTTRARRRTDGRIRPWSSPIAPSKGSSAKAGSAIDPYEPSLLQPSSVDVRVDRYFRVFHNARYPFIDVKQPQEALTEPVEIGDDEPFILHPGEFVLGSTLERVSAARTTSSPASRGSRARRLGLLIHSTAGFIDPGWDGHVTLELSNVANLPITIYHAMKIGQISFMQMTEPAASPYGSSSLGSKYQGQRGPTPSPLLAELHVDEDSRHRRDRIRRAADRACAARAGTATCARSCASPSARRTSARSGSSSSRATSPIRRACARPSAGCTHVVHLVAIIQGSADDFQRVMTQGTNDLVAAAQEAGVERFVLMSALGTSEPPQGTVPYYAAKWAEEQAVAGSGLEHVIFRPSFVFGRGGGALRTFVKQVRYSPVVTVIGAGPAALAADLGRRRRPSTSRARSPHPRRRTGRSSSAGPTRSTGTASTGRSPGCSASAGASCTFRSPSPGRARS